MIIARVLNTYYWSMYVTLLLKAGLTQMCVCAVRCVPLHARIMYNRGGFSPLGGLCERLVTVRVVDELNPIGSSPFPTDTAIRGER